MSNNTSRKTAKRAIKLAKRNIEQLQREMAIKFLLIATVTIGLFYAYAINGFLFASMLITIIGTIYGTAEMVAANENIEYERSRLSRFKRDLKILKEPRLGKTKAVRDACKESYEERIVFLKELLSKEKDEDEIKSINLSLLYFEKALSKLN